MTLFLYTYAIFCSCYDKYRNFACFDFVKHILGVYSAYRLFLTSSGMPFSFFLLVLSKPVVTTQRWHSNITNPLLIGYGCSISTITDSHHDHRAAKDSFCPLRNQFQIFFSALIEIIINGGMRLTKTIKFFIFLIKITDAYLKGFF